MTLLSQVSSASAPTGRDLGGAGLAKTSSGSRMFACGEPDSYTIDAGAIIDGGFGGSATWGGVTYSGSWTSSGGYAGVAISF